MINIHVIFPGTQSIYLACPFSYSQSSLPVSMFISSDTSFLFSLHFFWSWQRKSENKLCLIITLLFFSTSTFQNFSESKCALFPFLFLFNVYAFPNTCPPALISPLIGSLCFFSYKVNTVVLLLN